MPFSTRIKNLTFFFAAASFLVGCEDGMSEIGLDVVENSMPASIDTAILNIEIDIPQNLYIEFCIGAQCVPVGNFDYSANPTRCPWDTCSCSWVAAAGRHECEFNHDNQDHPFTNHPDDWDYIKIYNAYANTAVTIDDIKIHYRGVDPWNHVQEHTFVDSTNTDGLGTTITTSILLTAQQYYPLKDEVTLRRQNSLMAVSSLVNFNEMPWMVREAANDIGQSGIIKYKQVESTQNGCDEFYSYFAALYANNLHPVAEYPWVKTSFFSWDRDLFYLGYDEWDRAGRIVNTVQNPDGTISFSRKSNGQAYTPKAGDFLMWQDNKEKLWTALSAAGLSCNPFPANAGPIQDCCLDLGFSANNPNPPVYLMHAMMLIDDAGFQQKPTGDYDIAVLDKGITVSAHRFDVPTAGPAEPFCYNLCAQYRQNNGDNSIQCKESYYIGEVDHELGGSHTSSTSNNHGFLAGAPAYLF